MEKGDWSFQLILAETLSLFSWSLFVLLFWWTWWTRPQTILKTTTKWPWPSTSPAWWFLASVYISVSSSLPPTASIKYIEIWLFFNLTYPLMVILANIMLKVNKKFHDIYTFFSFRMPFTRWNRNKLVHWSRVKTKWNQFRKTKVHKKRSINNFSRITVAKYLTWYINQSIYVK